MRVVAEKGEAAICRPCFGSAVEERSARQGRFTQLFGFFEFALFFFLVGFFEKFGAQIVGKDETGNAEIVRGTVRPVEMGYEASAQRYVDRRTGFTQVTGRVRAHDGVDVHCLVRDAARDALVDHVDCTADRLAAVKKDRRPAQHFDAFGGQRIDRNRVVGRGIGNVDSADPVDQHLHALAGKPAQDRPRSTRSKAGGGDARHIGKNLAQLPVEIRIERRPIEDAGPGKQVELAQACGGDDDDAARIHAAVMDIVDHVFRFRRLRISILRSGRGCSRQRQGGKGGEESALGDAGVIQHIAQIAAETRHSSVIRRMCMRHDKRQQGRRSKSGFLEKWSGRGDSNARPQPWQGCALPLSYARSLTLYRAAWPGGEARS